MTPHEERNVQLAKDACAAFARNDTDALLQFITEDVEWVFALPRVVPHADSYRGHAGVRDFMERFYGNLEFMVFEPVEFLAKDDLIVILGHETLKIRATGKTFHNHWVMVIKYREGKICYFFPHEDSAAFLAAFTSAYAEWSGARECDHIHPT